MIPTRLDSPLARTFLRAEFDRFRTELEKHFGPISDAKIKEALALFKAIRRSTGRIVYSPLKIYD